MTSLRTRLALFSLGIPLLAFIFLNSAYARTVVDHIATCTMTKRIAEGLAIQSLLKCHAAVATKGAAVDPDCLDKAHAALAAKFASAEAKAHKAGATCVTEGDAPVVQDQVDALVSDFVAALRPAMNASKGTGAKLKLVGKYGATFFKAIVETPAKEVAALAAAETTLLTSFGKIDAKGTAQTTGDGTTSSGRVKAFVDRKL